MSTSTTTHPVDSPDLSPPRTPELGRVPAPDLGSLRTLRRLWPHVRPEAFRLSLSALFALLAMVSGLVMPLIIRNIVDGPIAHKDLDALWLPGSLLLLAGIGEALLFGLRRWFAARPAMRVQATLRRDLYERLQRLPVSYHDGIGSGQLLSRAVSDLATIRMFIAFAGMFLLVNSLTFLIGLIILFTLSWQLALVVLVMALPLIWICLIFEGRFKVLARRSQDQVGDLATTVEESILGVRILKAFGRSAHLGRSFLKQATELRDTEIGKSRVISTLWAAVLALPEIAIGICLFLGVLQVADGNLSAGSLVAFFSVAMIIRWPIDSLGWLLTNVNESASAAQRYFEVMDESVRITSPEHPVSLPCATGAADLRFEAVDFRYPDATPDRPDVLHGVDLHLAPGETVAVVGATGSGKTALTGLVNRLHDVTGGVIRLDGIDIRQLSLDDLRRSASVAFEEPILFSASVRENITMGSPTLTDEDVDRAIGVAQAEFVRELPWGLDTRVGEQGLNLSGGQRQRLALARAVCGNPRLLVLDDPLSALDIHTEAAVERALRSVLQSTTALIIAHRASTVMMADRVALLEGGTITALGTHQHLLATVPAYRALLTSDDTPFDRLRAQAGTGPGAPARRPDVADPAATVSAAPLSAGTVPAGAVPARTVPAVEQTAGSVVDRNPEEVR